MSRWSRNYKPNNWWWAGLASSYLSRFAEFGKFYDTRYLPKPPVHTHTHTLSGHHKPLRLKTRGTGATCSKWCAKMPSHPSRNIMRFNHKKTCNIWLEKLPDCCGDLTRNVFSVLDWSPGICSVMDQSSSFMQELLGYAELKYWHFTLYTCSEIRGELYVILL